MQISSKYSIIKKNITCNLIIIVSDTPEFIHNDPGPVSPVIIQCKSSQFIQIPDQYPITLRIPGLILSHILTIRESLYTYYVFDRIF